MPDRTLTKPGTHGAVWPLFLGTMVGGVATVMLVVAGLLRLALGEWFPMSTATALLLLAVSPWILRVARSQDFFRGDFLAATSLPPLGLVLGMCAWFALHRPVVSARIESTDSMDGAWVAIPPTLVFLGWLGGTMGKRMLAACARGDRRLRLCAWALVAVASLVTAFATARSLHFPDPDHYIASLPVMGHVPPRSQGWAANGVMSDGAYSIDETDVLAVRIRRICDAGSERERCWWRIDPSRGLIVEDLPSPTHWSFLPGRDDAADIRHDARNNLWVLDAGFGHGDRRCWTFLHDDPSPSDLHMRDIASFTSPPYAWIAGAWAGILIAFALMKARTKPIVDPLAHWVEAHYMGDGRVLAADGSLITLLAPDAKLATGPVVVQRPEAHATGTYRDVRMTEALRVHSGTLADVALAARLPPYTRSVLAMAAIVLTLAPLVAAACVGLLG